jgi:glycosyltransferase involved in cell wall biosynthesis
MISSFPPSKDGLAVYTYKLCKAIAKTNKNVRILVVSNVEPHDQNLIERVKVIKALENPLIYPLKVFKSIAQWRPDIIHCQHEFWLYGKGVLTVMFILMLLLLKMLRRPLVLTIHGMVKKSSLTPNFVKKHSGKYLVTLKRGYFLLLVKSIGKLSDRVIVHLDVIKRTLMEDYAYNENKVVVIPHGADQPIVKVDKYTARKELGLPKSNIILLCFGEIRRGKGLEYVINAMTEVVKKLPNIMLLIAGGYFPCSSPESKGYLNELKKEIEDLNLSSKVFIRAEFIPEQDVHLLFMASDIVLLPYVDTDIMRASGPFYRAMSYGRAVIASDSEMFRDITKNGELGFLVKTENVKKLAEEIILLASSDDLRSKIGEKMMKTLVSYGWKEVAARTLNLYNQMIK